MVEQYVNSVGYVFSTVGGSILRLLSFVCWVLGAVVPVRVMKGQSGEAMGARGERAEAMETVRRTISFSFAAR